MAHLDDDVAAYVDGQLDPVDAEAARRHLTDCERCRAAVTQQRQLKSRMGAAGDVAPPAHLLASLSSLPEEPPEPEAWWRRLLSPRAWGAAFVLVGASLVVVGTAYALGAPQRPASMVVSPPVDRYVQEFNAPTVTAETVTEASISGISGEAEALSVEAMEHLSANGWPCHPELAGDLKRLEGRLAHPDGAVSLAYSDGVRRLELHEQDGALDAKGLPDAVQRRIGDHWVRVAEHGENVRAVVWDAENVVYTLVTDLGDRRLAEVLTELPAAQARPGMAARLETGFARVSRWLDF